jgi:hypothetical protein
VLGAQQGSAAVLCELGDEGLSACVKQGFVAASWCLVLAG